MRTRIKFCGMTCAGDAINAAELGVDAIGLNFVGGPRRISNRQCFDICALLPTLVMPVLLGRGAAIHAILDSLAPSTEPANWLYQVYDPDSIELPLTQRLYWVVCPVASRESVRELQARAAMLESKLAITCLLLDTASAEKLGGTGKTDRGK